MTLAPTQPALGLMVVRVAGELDLFTVPRLARVLHQAVAAVAAHSARRGTAPAAMGNPRVVCDLDGVTYLGAAGLGVLVRAAAAARTSGVRPFELTDVPTVVRLVTDPTRPDSPRPPDLTPPPTPTGGPHRLITVVGSCALSGQG